MMQSCNLLGSFLSKTKVSIKSRGLGKREGAVSFWSYRGDELVAVEVVNDPATYMEARQCLDTRRFPDPKQIGETILFTG